MMTQYDPKDCVITVNGTYITGLDEDMVECSKDEDDFSTSVGAQGDVLVSESHNQLGTVTIHLQPTSPQVAFLRRLRNTKAVVPVWVTNKSIGSRQGGTQARIKKPADMAQGAEAEGLEFEFQIFDYTDE